MISNFKFQIKNYKNSAGFTIVEIVVVVAVAAVILAVVISSFSQIKLQFSLSRVTYKFAQDVRRAQDLTLSGVEYKDSQGNVQLISGYGVHVDLNVLGNKKYILYADKKPGNKEYDASDYIFETIDFSSDEPGVIIREIKNVSNFSQISVDFEPPNPTTTIMPLNQGNINIIFALSSDLTKSRTVSINKSGLIEVK